MTDTSPDYYKDGPFECILLAEQYSFNVVNMLKYVWRHHDKGHPKQDLEKALWYARRAEKNCEAFEPCKRYFRYNRNQETTAIQWPGSDPSTLLQIKGNISLTEAEQGFWYALANTKGAASIIAALENLIKETEE